MTTSKTVKTIRCDHCDAVIKIKKGEKSNHINLSSSGSFGRDASLKIGSAVVELGSELDFCNEKCFMDFFTAKFKEIKNE